MVYWKKLFAVVPVEPCPVDMSVKSKGGNMIQR